MQDIDEKEEIDARPASPCTRVCTLDDASVCLGCERTVDEIVRWARMSATEQRGVIRNLPVRRRARAEAARTHADLRTIAAPDPE